MENIRDLEQEYQRLKAEANEAYERKVEADTELDKTERVPEWLKLRVIQEVLDGGCSHDVAAAVWFVCRSREIVEEAAHHKAGEWDRLRQRVANLRVQLGELQRSSNPITD